MIYPIRILHVVGIMNRGGLETLLMNIYRNIDKDKIQFDFLVHFEEEGVYEKEILELGGKIYRVGHITKVGPIKYKKQLSNFFRDKKEYTIVHSHMDAMSGIILREAKKQDTPVRIAHSHNAYPKMGKCEKIYKEYSRSYVNRSCTDKFACSQDAAQWLFGKEIKNNELVILKNAIQPDKFKFESKLRNQKRRELGIDDDTLVIGNIARFNTQKNHEFLIDIFNELIKKEKTTKLILVGDGTLRTSIEKKVRTLGISEQVIFLGVREDIPDLLQVFDIFLFPSLHEGLGIVLIEAQSNGLKCIASTAVPKEADMNCNLVKFIDIKETSSHWADCILNESNYNRETKDAVKIVNDNGYNINNVAQWITDFYIEKKNYIDKN